MADDDTEWKPVQWGASDKDADIKYFNALGMNVNMWLWQSKGCNAAARILWDAYKSGAGPFHRFHRGVALMLAGYAAETLNKMVLIDAHLRTVMFPPAYARLDKYFPKSHKLRDLAKEARLRINEHDRRTLDQLSKYVTWSGKYPAPLKANDYDGPVAFAIKEEATAIDELWIRYTRLWPKLLKQAGVRLRN